MEISFLIANLWQHVVIPNIPISLSLYMLAIAYFILLAIIQFYEWIVLIQILVCDTFWSVRAWEAINNQICISKSFCKIYCRDRKTKKQKLKRQVHAVIYLLLLLLFILFILFYIFGIKGKAALNLNTKLINYTLPVVFSCITVTTIDFCLGSKLTKNFGSWQITLVQHAKIC